MKRHSHRINEKEYEIILEDLAEFLRDSFSLSESDVDVLILSGFLYFYNMYSKNNFFRFHIEETMIKRFDDSIVSISDPDYKEKIKTFIAAMIKKNED